MKNKTKALSLLIAILMILSVYLAVGLSVSAVGTPGELGEIDIYLIAGQSNAAGYGTGTIEESLTDTRYSDGFDNVLYFGEADNNKFSEFTNAKIGNGIGITRCGAEIGMAAALSSGNRMNAIIKYAKGGTPLWPDTTGKYAVESGTWTSPSYIEDKNITTEGTKIGLLYTEFISTVTTAVAELREMGYTPVLRGMWWMQGEAESGNLERATEYPNMLKYLISDLRSDLSEIFSASCDNMPFVMGGINGNHTAVGKTLPAYIANINAAQIAVCETVNNVYRVDTQGLPQIDEWHYSNQSQHTIGKQIIEIIYSAQGAYSVTYDAVGVKMSGGGAYRAGESVTVLFTPQGDYVIDKATVSYAGGNPNDITASLVAASGAYSYTFTMPEGNVSFSLETSDPTAEATPYGSIPSTYKSTADYPFVLFKAGKLYRVYAKWNDVLTDGSSIGSSTGDTTLLLRRDYNTDEDANSSQGLFTIKGKLTIDLGEKTLTRGKNHLFQIMAKYPEAKGVSTDITIKNGTLAAAGNAIFAINSHGDAGADDTFNFTLDSLTFRLAVQPEYVNSNNVTVAANTPTDMLFVTFTGGTVDTKVNATLNDCTFDLRTVAPKRAIDIFDLAETSGNKKTANITVNGGSFIADDFSKVTMSKLADGDSLIFKASDNGYATFTLKDTAAAPAIRVSAADGTYLELGAPVTDGSDKVYTLEKSGYIPTKYGDIPTAYASADAFPFVAFQGGVFYKAYACYYDFLTDIKSTRLTSETVLLLRRNYSLGAESGDAKIDNNDRNLNQLKAHLIIDLDGKTLNKGNLHLFQSMGNGVNITVTVKNGNVHVANGTAIAFNNTGSSATKEVVTYTFENITFTSASGLTNPILDTYTGGTDAGTVSNVTFNNCTFDLRGVTASGFVLFDLIDKTSGTLLNKVDHTVTVNGGKLILDKSFLSKFTFANYNDKREGENSIPDSFVLGKYNGEGFKLQVEGGTLSETPAFSILTSSGKMAYPLNYSASSNIAYFDFVEVSVAEESTPYGKIPASYPAARYPFALFVDGEFVKAYPTWFELCNSLGANISNTSGAKNTVLLRRNYSTSECYTSSQQLYQVKNKVVIDLGGNTFTRGSYHIFQLMAKDTAGCDLTELVIKNGTVLTANSPSVAVNTHGNASRAQSFSLTFESVTFAFAQGAGSKELLVTAYVGGNASKPENTTTVFLTYNNCCFDLGSTSGKLLFRLDENNGGTSANIKPTTVVINGGRIIASSFASHTLANLAEGDSVTFSRVAGGNYTELRQPTSAAAPTGVYNGGELTFVKTADDGTTATYVLKPTASIGVDFTPKASVTLDSNLIFNIYIPAHEGLGTVTLNGATVDLGEAEDGYYLITEELPANEAARELVLAVELTANGTPLKATFTFSTVKYAEKLLANAEISATEKTLIKDMLAYIASAYEYFNNGETVAEIVALLDGYVSGKVINVADAKCDTEGLSGATFVLEATPAIRFYLNGYTANKFSFKVGGRALNVTEDNLGGDANGSYIEFTLFAYEMTETFTYEIEGTAISGEYNIISYYADAAAKSDTALADIVAKFYNYCESASAYRQYVINNQ